MRRHRRARHLPGTAAGRAWTRGNRPHPLGGRPADFAQNDRIRREGTCNLIGAALAAEAGGEGEVYFVTDDEPVRLGEYLTWLARAVHAPAPLHVPAFLARLTLGSEMAGTYTASLRCRNDRLKSRLGWRLKYPTFRDGYAEVLPRLGAAPATTERKEEK